MLVKFYKIDDIKELYENERYVFETEMSVIPRNDELIFTEEQTYKVVEVIYDMESDEKGNYTTYQVDVTMIADENEVLK